MNRTASPPAVHPTSAPGLSARGARLVRAGSASNSRVGRSRPGRCAGAGQEEARQRAPGNAIGGWQRTSPVRQAPDDHGVSTRGGRPSTEAGRRRSAAPGARPSPPGTCRVGADCWPANARVRHHIGQSSGAGFWSMASMTGTKSSVGACAADGDKAVVTSSGRRAGWRQWRARIGSSNRAWSGGWSWSASPSRSSLPRRCGSSADEAWPRGLPSLTGANHARARWRQTVPRFRSRSWRASRMLTACRGGGSHRPRRPDGAPSPVRRCSSLALALVCAPLGRDCPPSLVRNGPVIRT